jgi:hypothetical protein
MIGHEIEHHDLAPDAEVLLPYGAREFAQQLGQEAVNGGGIIVQVASPETPEQLHITPAEKASRREGHTFGIPKVSPAPIRRFVSDGPIAATW